MARLLGKEQGAVKVYFSLNRSFSASTALTRLSSNLALASLCGKDNYGLNLLSFYDYLRSIWMKFRMTHLWLFLKIGHQLGVPRLHSRSSRRFVFVDIHSQCFAIVVITFTSAGQSSSFGYLGNLPVQNHDLGLHLFPNVQLHGLESTRLPSLPVLIG